MYQVENSTVLLRGGRQLLARRLATPRVARTVLLLGLVSLFTDISSEMVSTVLPLYLVYTLGLTPLQFGVLDGLYQGAGALVRVASGFVSDRTRRHKEVAVVGYGLSALCKLGFLATSGAAALGGIVVVDRTGKGIRTAPRDAMISLATPQAELGTAFGVHRALDTTGAMLGPLVAFGLLAMAPLAFNSVFVVSFCIALVGLAILVLFVEHRPAPAVEERPRVSLRAAAGLLRAPAFALVVAAGAALALMTASDGFVYLGLQRRLDFDPRFLPLLYVGTALVYMMLAVPAGRLADRVGRGRVFVGGYALLLLVYATLLAPAFGAPQLVLALLLLGTYYAATDGVLAALASAVLPAELRASGLSLLVTATTVGRLLASVLFGAIWTAAGLHAAIVCFAIGLAVAAAFAAALLARRPEAAA